jgi:hypothetical protein
MRLRLYENFRFLLYAPFYAAHAIGAYAAEGLEVELLPFRRESGVLKRSCSPGPSMSCGRGQCAS